jgi:hypothetical protein
LKVTGNGVGVIAHAGCAAVRLLADRTGLTGALSDAMSGARHGRGYDRGRVLVDVATAMADGLDTVRRMDLLSGQGAVFEQMASRSTRQRVIAEEIDTDRLSAIGRGRARVRARVWELIVARHGRIPAARMPGGDLGDQIVVRIDANFVQAHSRKQGAAKHRGRFGLHPLNVYCDNTREHLVSKLRAGNAGANDADDHIEVLTEAIFTQLPVGYRHHLLITIDGAGATHQLVEWLHELNSPGDEDYPKRRVEFSIGFKIDRYIGPVIHALPADAWVAMLTEDGAPGVPADLEVASSLGTVGQVAEITDRIPYLASWPPGLRVFVRRVKPLRDVTPTALPGVAKQLELDGLDATAAITGWRYEAFATNTTSPDIAWLDARHRVHARVEDRIRCGKHTGAAKYPFHHLTANKTWLLLHAIADDLLAWTQLLACDPALASAEPKTLQDRILHTPASLTHHSRRRWLNFPPHWPWTPPTITLFEKIQAIPAPG